MRLVKASPWVHLGRWVLGLTLLTAGAVLSGATAVWYFERGNPGANLKNWHDCLWWAIVTICTVGYGEHFPVTLGGRVIAVAVMMTGVAIIGAVAAMVAFGFGHRFAERLEAAVQHVQTSVDQDLSGAGMLAARLQDPPTLTGLSEVPVSVPDEHTAASLTWLLARLGWHPVADDAGLGWVHGGTKLRLVVRPWTTPAGVQNRLTFGAGDHQRTHRIAREATRHGFRRLDASVNLDRTGSAVATDRVALRAPSGFEVALVVSARAMVS